MHTSTTESVLSWHHFDSFQSLRNDYSSIFQLEQSRPSLSIKQSTVYPYVTSEDVDSILDSFEHNVNFWYPTMSRCQIERTRSLINSGVTLEDSIDACVALLAMALGCASQVTTDMENANGVSEQDARRRLSRRQMGDVYFNAALKRAYVAHLGVTSLSAQCLFYVGYDDGLSPFSRPFSLRVPLFSSLVRGSGEKTEKHEKSELTIRGMKMKTGCISPFSRDRCKHGSILVPLQQSA